MKAITIKQPWASLIVEGVKVIENRTWPTKFRGRVLIHAGAKSADFWDSPLSGRIDNFIRDITKSGTDICNYPFGAIIGSIEIVGCVINNPSIWADKSIDCKNGCPDIEKCPIGKCPHRIYNWVLANPIKFDKPIPAKGRLSFWNFELPEEYK